MAVYREYYEVVGADLLKKARCWALKRKLALDCQWEIVKRLGGEGFRPGHGGGISTVMFSGNLRTLPTGWRQIGNDKGRRECKPVLNIKAGKEAKALLSQAPRVLDWGQFADTHLNWKGRSPMKESGGHMMICFASGVHVRHPKERFFIQVPRDTKDRWTPPKGLNEVRESDMLRAVEDHNAYVDRKKKKA